MEFVLDHAIPIGLGGASIDRRDFKLQPCILHWYRKKSQAPTVDEREGRAISSAGCWRLTADGDDYTGSSEAMEVTAFAGSLIVLVLDTATPKHLARFAGYRDRRRRHFQPQGQEWVDRILLSTRAGRRDR